MKKKRTKHVIGFRKPAWKLDSRFMRRFSLGQALLVIKVIEILARFFLT